jgi:predicted neuraminidase
LFYKVGPNPDTWWGMVKESSNQGKSWSVARRLPEDIAGPVRAKPVLLDDGRLLCGSSTENKGWRVHMEWTTDLGRTWSRTEALNDGKDFAAIQPTILRHGGGKLQILCRSDETLRESWSSDGGKTWSPPTASILPNPSAGIDAVKLTDGRHLLVYNHSTRNTGKRSKLNVAVTSDGKHWKAAVKLEDGRTIGGKKAHGAYPGAILASDGLVHICYSWGRGRINYVVIDPDKLVLRDMPDGKWPEQS